MNIRQGTPKIWTKVKSIWTSGGFVVEHLLTPPRWPQPCSTNRKWAWTTKCCRCETDKAYRNLLWSVCNYDSPFDCIHDYGFDEGHNSPILQYLVLRFSSVHLSMSRFLFSRTDLLQTELGAIIIFLCYIDRRVWKKQNKLNCKKRNSGWCWLLTILLLIPQHWGFQQLRTKD